jgi:glycosyltransferase involved in cell wall biosynthesis
MVYYHVWDNFPLPVYNKKFYEANDFIATISKVTDDIVKGVAPNVERKYIPHAVESEVFQPIDKEEIAKYKKQFLKDENKFVFFWNNRNARRKSTGSLIRWYKTFYNGLTKEEQDNVVLLMHTDPTDAYGQDINTILRDWDFKDGQVLISTAKVPPENLAVMYNMADVTVNISDAEGFGLATLESLSCGTPIIVTMTGGLQEQVTDGEQYFGVGIEPCSKAVIGSQQVPYIYEDRISEEEFVAALNHMYKMSQEERDELGQKGREHVLKNYNFEDFNETWVNTMLNIHKDHGSWENRKKYKNWKMLEL